MSTGLVGRHPAEIEDAIAQGVCSIREAHRRDGTFLTDIALRSSLESADRVFTVYIPTYVVHALGCLPSRFAAAELVTSTLETLMQHREPGGCWRFFGRTKEYPPPDFDDTCCVLAAIKAETGRAHSSVLSHLERFRDQNGLFYTWMDDAANRQGFYRIDGVVNANILYYVAMQGIEVPSIVRYLSSFVQKDKLLHLSLYSISEGPAAYIITRLYRHANVRSLGSIMPELTRSILNRQRRDGGWDNALETALATVSLLNAGYRGGRLRAAIQTLLHSQSGDGSWPAMAFCQDFTPAYYGASSLTTSLCLEALAKYLSAEDEVQP